MKKRRRKPGLYLRAIRLQRFRLQQRLAELGVPDYTVLTIFSILVGGACGFAAVIFHDTVALIRELFFHVAAGQLLLLGGLAVILFPAVGMLIQGLMIYLSPQIAPRRGVLEVIKAVAMRGGHIPFKTTLFHFLAPAVCIGSGGTVGPEGPIAQLGGGVASKLGALFGLSDTRRRMFTAAGAGAAIAAVFNTPLGGIFFAIEVVLLNDFRGPAFSVLILASVAASAVAHIFLGDHPTFVFGDVLVGTYKEFYLYAFLGMMAGLLSVLYIRYSESLHDFFNRYLLKKMPRWLLMMLVGLAVGGCGYFYPSIFGVGYDAINEMLAEALPWQTVAVLLVMKFVLVPLILHAGGFGGIFAPSLFIGACLGFLYALVLNAVGVPVDGTAYVLVSMGAVLGGINSIPISAILIIFEMSREYAFILPLMLGVGISTTIVRLFIKQSIYQRHLEREGYRLTRGHESSILRSLQVKDVMREDVALIPEDMPLPKLIRKIIESPHNTFYTVNRRGRLAGMIAESELRPIIMEYQHLQGMLVAKDIARPGIVTVREDDNLEHVLQLFGQENVDEFPVVSAADPDRVAGSIWQQDIIKAYHRESLKHNLADGLAGQLKTLEKNSVVPIADSYAITERLAPGRFVGRTLAQLRLRNKYGLEVLMIRPAKLSLETEDHEPPIIMARPDYRIQPGDSLVLFGDTEAIRATEHWQ